MKILVRCPYCHAEYKKITANHLVKHNIDYLDFLKEYDSGKYYLKVLSEFIWDFYKPCISKFIEQVYSVETKKYIWITKYAMSKKAIDEFFERCKNDAEYSNRLQMLSNTRNYPFCKSDIIKHIKKERTIGIYTYSKETTFLTFDIDEDNMKYVEEIYYELKRVGIDDNQILMSWSGNKGYHITVFFNNPILKSKVNRLFNLIMWSTGISDIIRENGSKVVESRGTSNQAVKIPFSINRKNKVEYRQIKNHDDWTIRTKEGKGNYCFLINEYGGETDTLNKIVEMQKIEISTIDKIISDLEEEKAFYEAMEKRTTETYKDELKEIEIKKLANKVDIIRNGIEALLCKPIEAKERNKTLLKIAIYNKSNNMSSGDNERFLINYTTDKNINHKFETAMDENIREIKSIIKTIYYSETANKYQIFGELKELSFTRNEIFEILSIKEKHLRKFYFIMFTHYKMFGNKRDNQFFMTYETIKKSLDINGKTINNRLTALEELNKIEFVRKGEWDNCIGKIKNKPNIYKLKYNQVYEETDKVYKLSRKSKDTYDVITFKNFEMMCAKVLSKDEIIEYFNMPKSILKYKNQKLVDI